TRHTPLRVRGSCLPRILLGHAAITRSPGAQFTTRSASQKASAATIPAPGSVSNHAARMFPATPHRTAEKRRVAPAPITDEVMVCVVEIGASNTDAVRNNTDEADASAANPFGGSSSMMRLPSVRMIRQPPEYVPNDNTAAVTITVHSGIVNSPGSCET